KVQQIIEESMGVKKVQVDYKTGKAIIVGTPNIEELKKNIEMAGYKVKSVQ
ncbi:MAG: heavy-metal-associated domain-containing protein, partial [Clostridia bacterium]|nr:heavy-metal-associated domain-containing protein [Clostridia bacterium]